MKGTALPFVHHTPALCEIALSAFPQRAGDALFILIKRFPETTNPQDQAITMKALVVIDMLNDFVTGVLANQADAERIIPQIRRLIEFARSHPDWLVVYSNDAHRWMPRPKH